MIRHFWVVIFTVTPVEFPRIAGRERAIQHIDAADVLGRGNARKCGEAALLLLPMGALTMIPSDKDQVAGAGAQA